MTSHDRVCHCQVGCQLEPTVTISMAHSVVIDFDWTVYAFDPTLCEEQIRQAHLQHRVIPQRGAVLLQEYNFNYPDQNLSEPFHIPYSIHFNILKLFMLKKAMLGKTFLAMLNEDPLIFMPMLSRLTTYISYYHSIQDSWLGGVDPTILHRWWNVESTRDHMFHSPVQDDPPKGGRSDFNSTVVRACKEWWMSKVWNVGDVARTPEAQISESVLHIGDWIENEIIRELGHCDMTNEDLPKREQSEKFQTLFPKDGISISHIPVRHRPIISASV